MQQDLLINNLKSKPMEVFNEQFYEEIKRAVKDGIIEGFKEARSMSSVKPHKAQAITSSQY